MEPLDPIEPPPNWGQDELSNFLEIAERNAYTSFVTLGAPYAKLLGIDAFYHRLIENLNNPRDCFAAFLFFRSHSCFLAATRSELSGQIPETYLLLRGCLENGLYGFYIARRPDPRKVWLSRHDDDAAMRAVKNEFKIVTIMPLVEAADQQAFQATRTLYDRTITLAPTQMCAH